MLPSDVSQQDDGDRVRKGADLLDRERPGWENCINLETLDIDSGLDCVLGQVYGDYITGKRELDLMPLGSGGSFGFLWGEDTQAWRNLITLRRQAKTETPAHPVPWAEKGLALIEAKHASF